MDQQRKTNDVAPKDTKISATPNEMKDKEETKNPEMGMNNPATKPLYGDALKFWNATHN